MLEIGTYNIYDECYGVVVASNSKGCHLKLDDGSEAFSFDCLNLRKGSEVICSIKKKAALNRKILVSIDSIIEYAPISAA